MTPPRVTLTRSVIPSLASIAVHAALALALLGVTIERFTATPPRPARLSIEASAPPAAPPAEDQTDAPTDAPVPPDTQPPDAEAAREEARRAADDAAARLEARPESAIARAAPALPPSRAPSPAAASAAPPPPAAAFAGVQAQAATRIVFAVDASGAMVTSFSFVQDELARAIERLQPTQSFQIVLFGERTADGTPQPFRTIPHTGGDDDLIRATAGNRILARRWVYNALPGGRSNPVEGLTRALELDPDLVFLLARGIQRTGAATDPADQQATLSTLDALNPTDPRSGLRPAIIKAIEFVEPDPTGLIEQIARAHGDGEGSLRLITPENTADPEPPSDTPGLDPAQRTALNTAARALSSLAGADTALLAGIATHAETLRARVAATDALERLEAFPPPTRRTTDPRPHLLRARAALLAAATEPHPPRRTDLALRALADLEPLRVTDPAAAAERDTLAAYARLELDQPDAAHAALLALLRTADPTDPNLDDARRAALAAAIDRARIAMIDAATALGPETPEAARARDAMSKALPSVRDPATRALAAGALARANLAARTPDPLAPLTALYADPALPLDTRRALAAPRLAVLTAGTPAGTLPIDALRALADHAAWPPADHARATDLLEALATRTADRAEQAGSLRDAALHARRAGQGERSRALAFRMAAQHPDHPDAEAALTLALDTPDPDPADLERAIDLDPDHPLADTWRLTLAHASRGDKGLGLLEGVRSRPAAALALDLIDELLPQTTDERARADLLARAADEARRLGDDLDPERRLLIARSLAATDPARAIATLDALPPSLATSARADRARLDAAIARATQDETAEAELFATARTIAERRTPSDKDVYWEALTLWLELGAARGGPDAARAARLRVAALRQDHPALGGDPWRARLNALAD